MKIHKMVRKITTAYAGQNTVPPADLIFLFEGVCAVAINFDKAVGGIGKAESDTVGGMVGQSLAGMSRADQVGPIGERIKEAAAKAKKHGVGHGTSVPGFSKPIPNPIPAIPVKQSKTDEYLICLECGDQFKMIKRHLAVHHDTTPNEYRRKWRLEYDYPMIAPGYSASQRKMAIARGFGKGNRKS